MVSAAFVAVSLLFLFGHAGSIIAKEVRIDEKIVESIKSFYPLLCADETADKKNFLSWFLDENLSEPDRVVTGNFPSFYSVKERLTEFYSDVYESNSYRELYKTKKDGILFPEIPVPSNIYKALETTTKSVMVNGNEYEKKGLVIKNHTSYTPDIPALFSQPAKNDKPCVLILHTHGTESYNPYDRSENTEENIVRVGREMAKVFKKNNIDVIHTEVMHDIPRFNSSYSKSLKTVKNEIAKNPQINVVLDVHRDAMLAENGDSYKTVCEYNGEKIAQIMFVVGTDGNGLSHPNWKKNLSLALKFQEAVNKICPNLARPVDLRKERFNQQATEGSLIIEVGTNGNTLSEAVKAGVLAAEGISSVLNKK